MPVTVSLAGGLVVAFLLRPIVVVDSEATSLFHRRGLVGLLAIDRQAIGCFDRENRHGWALPCGCCKHPRAAASPVRRVKGRGTRAQLPLMRRAGMRHGPMPTLGVLLRARCWPPHAALRSAFQSSARGRDRAKRDPVSSAMGRIRLAYTSPCRLLSVAATSSTLARVAKARIASSVAGAHPPPVLT